MNRIFFAGLLAFSALPVMAADSVAVFAVDNCAQDLTSSSARQLRSALSQQGGAKVQSEEQTLAALGGPVRGSVEDAERLLASARVTFREDIRKERKIHKLLDDATAMVLSLPPSESRRWKTLCDVLSFQSQVYYMTDKAKAEAAIEPILRVDQFFQIDHERYSPDMWKLVDKVRKRLKASATATLSVMTWPGGLPVYVGGKEKGTSPLTVDLPPGNYRVEALFGKERTLARTVKLKDGVAIELEQSLDGAVRVGSGPCLATSGTRDARLVAMMKLAAFLRVDQVVGVWQEEPAKDEVYVVAAAVESKSGQQVREAKIKAIRGQVLTGDLEKLGQFITKGDAAPPVEAVVTKPKPVPKELAPQDDFVSRDLVKAGSGRSGYRTAAYISGGVAIAAFGLGAYGFVAASAKQKELDKIQLTGTVSESDRNLSNKLDSEVKSRKTLGYASIGVGIAAAGAAVGLYLYSSGGLSGSKTKIAFAPNVLYFTTTF